MPPLTIARTRWRFGSNRRAVTLCAWLTFRPTTGPLPQISQRFAIKDEPDALKRMGVCTVDLAAHPPGANAQTENYTPDSGECESKLEPDRKHGRCVSMCTYAPSHPAPRPAFAEAGTPAPWHPGPLAPCKLCYHEGIPLGERPRAGIRVAAPESAPHGRRLQARRFEPHEEG
jgi:hypothetical protein